MSKKVDDGTISLELGNPMILKINEMSFWMLIYIGPSVVSKCIGIQVSYINGGLVTTYSLNLGLEQVFYLEPFHSLFSLALVRPHYEAITLEKLKEVKS